MAQPIRTTTPVGVSLPPDLVRKIKAAARAEDRTFSNMLAQLVRLALESRNRQTNPQLGR
jgi:metal-responsive CopG/Arc/MetJ family transcriptional regulator